MSVAYVTWRLDPTLSPSRYLSPVVASDAQARATLEQAARNRKRSAGGSGSQRAEEVCA